MDESIATPPVLSTPAAHVFEVDLGYASSKERHRLSPEELNIRYEIHRTIAELKRGRWKRIALQFPDEMLSDAPAVSERLSQGLKEADDSNPEEISGLVAPPADNAQHTRAYPKVFILADTSYGACCVDEVAAEHVNAEVVVHYGRACLSPTARLPVIHIFTRQPLVISAVVDTFESIYLDHNRQVILMSDVTYSHHLDQLHGELKDRGYNSIFTPRIVHDPSSPIPNRTVPELVVKDPSTLSEWDLFHVSDPAQSLLLTLSSRVSNILVYPTAKSSNDQAIAAIPVSTSLALRRRYALVTSVSTAAIFGILINTLSVKNYLHIVEHVKSKISAAGKKSYMFVVGKVNAAKVANFSEVGAWVVIGCWESSLIDSRDFWKPVLTPFELEIALEGDDKRVWTGEWNGDFQRLLEGIEGKTNATILSKHPSNESDGNVNFEDESAPPEFDLRNGRYITDTRPMRKANLNSMQVSNEANSKETISSLARRANGDLAVIGKQISPGADFLRSKRTWAGLGSDFDITYDRSDITEGALMEEGLNGIARGYADETQSAKMSTSAAQSAAQSGSM